MNTPHQPRPLQRGLCLGTIAAEAAPAGAPGRLRLTPTLRPDPARRSAPHALNATFTRREHALPAAQLELSL